MAKRKPAIRVLVTGVGAPGTSGTLFALRNNSERTPVYVVGTDIKAEVVGRYLVNAFYQLPPPENGDYCDHLLDICRSESIDVVIPQTTRESHNLSYQKMTLAAKGVRIMVSDYSSMEIANNKWKLLQAFQSLQLPHPRFYLTKSEEELTEFAFKLGYPEVPVVVKPPMSNGMRGLRILKQTAWDTRRYLAEKPSGTESTLQELLDVFRRGTEWPELLVTEFMPGTEYSVDAFMGERVEVAIPRARNAIQNGISVATTLEYRDDISQFTLKAAKSFGLRFAFGFQFKLNDAGIPLVLECNPRVQGTMVASVFSGVNVIWMGVQELLGNPPSHIPERLHEASFYRSWSGIAIVDGKVHEI